MIISKDTEETLKKIQHPFIIKTLKVAQEIFASREMAVVREISKIYEETIIGTATDIIEIFEQKEPKGEIVFMIAPPTEEDIPEIDLDSLLRQKLQYLPLKTAVKEIVTEYGLNKNDVYAKALEIKNEIN